MNIKTGLTLLRKKSKEINLPPSGKEVVVGLSGGVDSAVVALLLKKMGYKIRCVFLVCWDSNYPGCTSKDDQKNAIKIASQLDLPIEVVDFQKEYQNYVMEYFWSEYKLNRVPNADIVCNKHVKFSALTSYIKAKHGVDWLATGHYALNTNGDVLFKHSYSQLGADRDEEKTQLAKTQKALSVDENTARYQMGGLIDNKIFNNVKHDKASQRLARYIGIPKDTKKDQSYFLCQLPSAALDTVTFPLGVFTKEEVRQIAREGLLVNSEKKDSQGICFIGDVDMQEFIKSHIKLTSGNIIDSKGNVIGEHRGLPLYTIGQRHNLNIRTYNSLPSYVIDKDVTNNSLVVGNDIQRRINEFSVILDSFVNLPLTLSLNEIKGLQVRIRNLGELNFCTLYTPDQVKVEKKVDGRDGTKKNDKAKVFVKLSKNETNVNPGQHAVFYFDNVVINSGIIDLVNTSYKRRFDLTR